MSRCFPDRAILVRLLSEFSEDDLVALLERPRRVRKAARPRRRRRADKKASTPKSSVVAKETTAAKGATPKSSTSKENPSNTKKGFVSKSKGAVETSSPVDDQEDLRVLLRKMHSDIRKHRGPCGEAEFRKMVDHLLTMVPPPKRCRVSVKRLPPEEVSEEYGYVDKDRDKFEIVIDDSLTEYETEHVLLHEWAHMLAWQPYHPLMGDHSANWGVWYSLVWRKYHGVE